MIIGFIFGSLIFFILRTLNVWSNQSDLAWERMMNFQEHRFDPEVLSGGGSGGGGIIFVNYTIGPTGPIGVQGPVGVCVPVFCGGGGSGGAGGTGSVVSGGSV